MKPTWQPFDTHTSEEGVVTQTWRHPDGKTEQWRGEEFVYGPNAPKVMNSTPPIEADGRTYELSEDGKMVSYTTIPANATIDSNGAIMVDTEGKVSQDLPPDAVVPSEEPHDGNPETVDPDSVPDVAGVLADAAKVEKTAAKVGKTKSSAESAA